MNENTCSNCFSDGWAKDDLIYQWKKKDPVQVVPGLHLPRFTLEQYKSDYCDVITNTGSYSCLKVELIFKREFSYYMLTIYVPCCMLVIVSWVSYRYWKPNSCFREPILKPGFGLELELK